MLLTWPRTMRPRSRFAQVFVTKMQVADSTSVIAGCRPRLVSRAQCPPWRPSPPTALSIRHFAMSICARVSAVSLSIHPAIRPLHRVAVLERVVGRLRRQVLFGCAAASCLRRRHCFFRVLCDCAASGVRICRSRPASSYWIRFRVTGSDYPSMASIYHPDHLPIVGQNWPSATSPVTSARNCVDALPVR